MELRKNTKTNIINTINFSVIGDRLLAINWSSVWITQQYVTQSRSD